MATLPDTQLHLRPGIIDFGWGHPTPALLPAEALGAAAASALARRGADALGYGPERGPGSLIAQILARIGRIEGVAPSEDELMVTGGISAALDMLCAQLSRPGDVVLVEAPTYHLALRIFRDRGLRLVAVPSDADGLRVDRAAATLGELRAKGERVALLYVVANFGNPSGALLIPERRAALVELARSEGFYLIEDDAYGELWYDTPPPTSLYSLAPAGPVVRLGSYAKILAPGLRLGWMLAAPELLRRCAGCGVLDSGGGVNHLTAMVLAELLGAGFLDAHVAGLRAALGARRDVLIEALAQQLPADCSWSAVRGGYFVLLQLPAGFDAAKLLPYAEQAGVAFLPGSRFFVGEGGAECLRLSFSLLLPDELQEGARRLGAVLHSARPSRL